MADARGPADPLRPGRGSGARARRENGSVRDVAIGYLDGQVTELLTQDPEVRSGSPEAVHDMRSATRRLRSALEIYAGIFDPHATADLGHELKWLAKVLGRPRDAEVVRERLRARIAELPKESGTERVAGPIEQRIGAAYDVAYARARKALKSKRYHRLLEDLGDFRDHPPATDRARRTAISAAAGLVNHQARIVDRAHRAMVRSSPGHARDVALHRLRKATKRLLHGAESVAGIYPKHALTLARTARRLQRILGNHQDSVMTRAFLDSLAADPDLPADTQLACRRISDIEEDIARTAAKTYARTRRKSPALRLRR
ncbi:CHAD domain-containing protein [Paeniglutamicibacter sp. MACA_103]|uniref:CHAD domain-containing protein n=1 Tax=Paeniglutamicibacter sp. MACA_103 TaxID=3377337 RepID=UPI0038960752